MFAGAAQYEKKAGSSYSNLVSYVVVAHPDYEKLLSCNIETRQSPLETFFRNTKLNIIYGRLDLIICGLLSFSTVENRTCGSHVKHSPISLPTIMTCLQKLTEVTENKIASLLPSKVYSFSMDGLTVQPSF